MLDVASRAWSGPLIRPPWHFFAACLGRVLPSIMLASTLTLIWLASPIHCAPVILTAAIPHA
jgi:hypothetical protein